MKWLHSNLKQITDKIPQTKAQHFGHEQKYSIYHTNSAQTLRK